MASKIISGKDIKQIGFKGGELINTILQVVHTHYKNKSKNYKIGLLRQVFNQPDKFDEHKQLGRIVSAMNSEDASNIEASSTPQDEKPIAIYGRSGIDEKTIDQMDQAMSLPIVERGALMPDAHVGYGLPIGGVLATENEVIPYAVGVDIGCRMCLSIFDLPANELKKNTYFFKNSLKENTRFGNKEVFKNPNEYEVLEHSAFDEISFLQKLKGKALRQIGSSGGGNHFAEFGEVLITDPENEWGLEPGEYMGLLTHSGSRGLGAEIAIHYTRLAKMLNRSDLVNKNLAWLDLDSEAGQEYWIAMNLAGDYSASCHFDIHTRIMEEIGAELMVRIENHHNFAWKETIEGKEYIVHRKGATPAAKGELGIIPGSMMHAGYIVRGLGNEKALNSASHGAGRLHSRKKAKQNFSKKFIRQQMKKKGITLIGGGVDEAPMAYKNIDEVMQKQTDLVEVVGKFQPRIVRMNKDG